jgi:divalent metal cation (Fe/Co/Zn/Cd) transporter
MAMARPEFISAAVEGTLIGTAGLIIIYKAVNNLINPVELQKIDYGIYLVGGNGSCEFCNGYLECF